MPAHRRSIAHNTTEPDTIEPDTIEPATIAEGNSRRAVPVLALLAGLLATLFVGAGSASASSSNFHTRTTSESNIGTSVLRLLNQERVANHLPRLYSNTSLKTSARRHDYAMARANQMTHQVAGEPDLGRRVSAAGYQWHTCGENVAWTSVMTEQGVLQLEREMFAEHAPNNGHRLNIISHSFRNIGIDVYFDTVHHKAWLTEDFAAR